MKPLIKIRLQYLKRNPWVLCGYYLFLPLLFIVGCLLGFIIGDKDMTPIYPEKEPYKYNEEFIFPFYQKDFKNFTEIFFYFTNKDECKKFNEYLGEQKNKILTNCSKLERDLKFPNIIKFEQKDGKHRISYYQKEKNIYQNLKNDKNTKPEHRFNNTFIDSGFINKDDITNLFYYNNISLNNISADSKDKNVLPIFSKFFELQSLIANFLIWEKNQTKVDNNKKLKMSIGYNSYPRHYNEFSLVFESLLFASLVGLQFILQMYSFNLRMIDEKENKLNILLERQGISKYKYSLSWFITYIILFFLTMIGMSLFLIFFIRRHIFLIIITIFLFTISLYAVCNFFFIVINTNKTASTVLKFYYFGSLFLGMAIIFNYIPKFTKILFAFIPQINLYISIHCIHNLNIMEKLTWENLWLNSNKISYFESIILFIVDIIFYLLLGWIIQLYKDSGLEFLDFIKSFYKNVSRNINPENKLENNDEIDKKEEKVNFEVHHQELSEINKKKKEENQCLEIINVCKNFDEVKAVDYFNGQLFSNEIFCLLGHNGAGKTTLINMISGIMDPNHGDIKLNGRSIVTDKNYLYRNIGLCQQQDIFFDYLTVKEHLEYMCEIKGSEINRQEINNLIEKIDLASKKNSLCSTLSGGQKRKLCIALALIGGSKIILLDEPTSGMDVLARRALWEFLKNYKNNKILLITTHFLDEAEYLGDRIGIMTDGHFLCSGTSSFLKSKYPCGFNINLLINQNIFNEYAKQQIFQEILKYEPKAEIKVASKGIFSINIQSNNQNISEIFGYIEENKGNLGIEDYTVNSTSLEDVFLKINNKANLNDLEYEKKNINYNIQNEGENENDIMIHENIIRVSSFCQQLKAQIIRSLYPLWRSKSLFIFELLSGLGFVYIFIFFFSDTLININNENIEYNKILGENDLIVYESVDKYLENSDMYKNIGGFSFKKIEEKANNFIDFSKKAYNKALGNIARGALYIDINNNDIIVYNLETKTNKVGYLFGNSVLVFSAFLKQYYDIDATIITGISHQAGKTQDLDNLLKNFSSVIICLITFFGFVIFLGGLMFEKIREKRNNIKHLLYLSGNNRYAYWIGFYIVDYIKLLFFNLLLFLPLFKVTKAAYYIGLDLLVSSISSLSFIYFITFFCNKEEQGGIFLFLIIFGIILIIAGLLLLLAYVFKVKIDFSNFLNPSKVNPLDFVPITNMIYAFILMFISHLSYEFLDDIKIMGVSILEEKDMEIKRPYKYLLRDYIVQSITFLLYTSLLGLAESGILQRYIHYLQVRFILYRNNYNYTFSKEKASEEFISSNNLNTDLTYKTNTNNNINLNQPLINDNNLKIKLEKNVNSINSDDELLINDTNEKSKDSDNINNENIKKIIYQSDNPYIMNEINKLNSGKDLTTRIEGLIKTFFVCCGRNVRAINNLYLGLEQNEKFGLLGFNGSGKTTTFKTITNEILADYGTINLFGYDNKRQFKSIRTMIGYCPQVNPLFDFMKVKEIIKFYLELKTCNENVESICAKFGLSKYLNTYTKNLSGGNKRKLTFAIAMMNKPTLLLLDEPSTGVDPESRRIMWRNINELSNSGHKYNMILTTHSMEEAEILCDTVSWLKRGSFICIGNPEQLKIKYSAGYKLHLKFDDNIILNTDIGTNNIEQTYNTIYGMVSNFDSYKDYIMSKPAVEPYIKALIKVIERIKDKTIEIKLDHFRKDFSFELVLKINKEKQKELFIEILDMKNKFNEIGEMNISMQSLENILTSLN